MLLAVVTGAFASTALAQSDVCMLPVDQADPCDGICLLYFHNMTTGRCEPFWSGCCPQTANHFETLAECEATCPPTGNLCTLPLDAGICAGVCPRYYFNQTTGQCEEFMYGCCGGNANNFATLEDCQNACEFEGDICTLPVQPGPGEYHSNRYYYDVSTGECRYFDYSQFGGNANNFAMLEDCEAACGTTQVVGPIPATTAWGQVVMLLLVLASATVIVKRRQAACRT